MSKKFRVSGVVTTMRGSSDANGNKENVVLDFEVGTEDEARDAWKKDVSSDHNNLDWSISGVEEITE